MKILKMAFLLLIAFCDVLAQTARGTIVVDRLNAPSLQNSGGENPVRRVTVYLPPGYSESDARYPVIYYLHGFTWSDSLQIAVDHFDQLLDKAIAEGKIRPVIVVMPDQHTLYRGSMYTNSTLTGNWADFTAKDLVNHVDKKYRTIPHRESRGITGHSMGGYGAIKLGMQFPEVFSCAYALSPGLVGLAKEIGPSGDAYKRAYQVTTREELIDGWNEGLANVVVAMGRAFSPNPGKPPFYADLPFSYKEDSLIIDYKILDLWNKHTLIEMADTHMENLKMLKALKLDWGRNEEFDHIPVTCMMFSQKLENLGIYHYAEEYIGTHGNKLWTEDGRALNDMLPFFDTYLVFDSPNGEAMSKKITKGEE